MNVACVRACVRQEKKKDERKRRNQIKGMPGHDKTSRDKTRQRPRVPDWPGRRRAYERCIFNPIPSSLKRKEEEMGGGGELPELAAEEE